MNTKTAKLSFRDGDTMVETVTTTSTTPATIDYFDILDSCEIVPDGDYDPFDCDGLEHETAPANRFDHDASKMRGICHNGNRAIVVTVDREQMRRWRVYDHARANGANRQVAHEMEALNLRRTIDYITKIYQRGPEGYGVVCEYMEEHSSCWGYDDYDYAQHSAIHDHAAEICPRARKTRLYRSQQSQYHQDTVRHEMGVSAQATLAIVC